MEMERAPPHFKYVTEPPNDKLSRSIECIMCDQDGSSKKKSWLRILCLNLGGFSTMGWTTHRLRQLYTVLLLQNDAVRQELIRKELLPCTFVWLSSATYVYKQMPTHACSCIHLCLLIGCAIAFLIGQLLNLDAEKQLIYELPGYLLVSMAIGCTWGLAAMYGD